MRQSTERSNLRKKAELAYREYRALLILASRLTAVERKQVDESLENLPRLSRSQLQVEYTKLRGELIDLRRMLGAKASLAEYEELLKHIADTSVDGSQREDADQALGSAHALLLILLRRFDDIFKLGLPNIDELHQDFARCWKVDVGEAGSR